MSTVDTRVVEMRFDNRQFEQGVRQTQMSVSNLKKSLNFEDSGKSLQKLSKTANDIKFDSMAASLDAIKKRFTTLGIVGMNIINKLTDAGINFGKKLVNSIQKPIDIAINKGRDRVAAIEDSKFQLKGLGIIWDEQRRAVASYEEAVDGAVKLTEAHMTEAERLAHKVTDSIADDIDYGVKDTAYGLGDAAKVAAQLSASGIQIGDGMREALRGISGVAAMTNSTYEDIGNIFTRIAGNGRLMGDDLLSISSRGMNAAASLANYFNSSAELMEEFSEKYNQFKKKNQEAIDATTGATEQSIRELITNGGLDFKTFASAMDSAFGEHAKEGNTTYAGSLANISSALARIGALFQGPLREKSIPLFNAIRTFVNSSKGLFEPIAKAFERIVTTISGGLVNAFNTAENAIESFKKNASGWEGWKPFKDGIWALGEAINYIIEIFGRAIREIFLDGKDTNSMLQQAAISANKFSQSMHDFYGRVLENSDKIKNVFQGFISFFRILGQIFGPILKGIGQLISYFFGFDSVIFNASSSFGALLKKLADSKVIFKGVTKGVEVAVKVITGFFNLLRGGRRLIVDFFKTLKERWNEKVDEPGFAKALEGFKGRWAKHFEGMRKVGEGFKKFFKGLWDFLKPAFKKLGEMFSVGFDSMLDALADFMNNMAKIFKPGGYEGITGVVNFASVMSVIGTMFSRLLPPFIAPFKTLSSFMADISTLPGKIGGFFGSLSGVFSTYKKKIQIDTVKEIGKTLLILAVSLLLLSSINQDDLARSFGVVSLLLSEMMGVMVLVYGLSKFSGVGVKMGDMFGLGSLFTNIATAVLLMAIAIKIISKVDAKQLRNAVISLTIMLAAVAAIIGILLALDNKLTNASALTGAKFKAHFAAIGFAIQEIAFAAMMLAVSLKILSTIEPERMASAIIGFAAGFAVLVVALKVLGSSMYGPEVSQGFNTKTGKEIFSKTKLTAGRMVGMASALLILVPVMLTLSASIKILSTIPIDKMGTALLGFAAGFAVLVIALEVLGSSMYGPEVSQGFNTKTGKEIYSKTNLTAGRMAGMAASLLILVPVMLALTVSMKILSTIPMDKLGPAMLGFAAGFAVLVMALKVLGSSMYGPEVSQGFNTKTGKEIYSKTNLTAGRMAGMAAALLILVPVMISLAASMKILSTIPIDGLASSMLTFAAGFAVLVIALKVLGSSMYGPKVSQGFNTKTGKEIFSKTNLTAGRMAGMAASLLILVPVMLSLAASIKLLSTINIASMGSALLGFAGGFAVLVAALLVLQGATNGIAKKSGASTAKTAIQLVGISTALVLFAGAALILAPAMKILSTVSWEGLAKGLIAIAGAITMFTVAAIAMNKVPLAGVLKLSAILVALGAGMALIGAGFLMAGLGLLNLTTGLTAFAGMSSAMITQVMTNFSLMLNGFLLLLPSIIVNVLNVIGALIVGILDIIIKAAPKIGEALIVLINTLCDVLIQCVPRLIETGLTLLLALIEGIANNIQRIVAAGLAIIENFIRGLAEGIPGIIDAALDFVVAFVGGIARGVKEHSAEIGSAVGEFIGAMYKGLADGIASFWTTITPFVNDLQTLESERIIKGAQAINAIFGMIFTGTVLGNMQNFFAFFGGVTVEKLGEQLATFGACFAQFSDYVKNVDPAALAATSGALDSFARVLVGIGVSGFNTFDFAIIGPEFASFGRYFADFAASIRSLTAQDVIQSTILAMMMKAILTVNLPRHGGLVDWIMGSTNNYSYVGADLALLAKNLLELRQYIKDFTPADAEQAAIMGQVMRSLLEVNLPRQGGLAQVFAGDNSMSTIGPQLVPFAENLADYMTQLRKMKLSDQDKTNAEIMKEVMTALFGVKLPNQGGLAGLIMGENSLEVIGPQITPFAVHMTHFFNEMRRMGLTEQDTANTKIMMESVKEIFDYHFPNQGGLAGLIMGENSLEVVGPQITPFAVHMTHFFNEMRRMGLTDQDTVNTRVMMESVKELFSVELPKQGGVVQWWTGENNLGTIAPQIALFGEGFSKYVKAIQGSGTGDAAKDSETVTKALKDLFAIDFSSAKGDFWQGGYSDIILAAQQLPLLGAGVGGFFKAIQDVNTSGYNVSDVIGMINAVATLGGSTQRSYKDVGNELKELGNSLKIFSKDVQEEGGDTSFVASFENTFLDIIRICEENQVRLHDVASGITNSFISGLTHYDGRDAGFTITQYFTDAISGTIATFKAYAGPFSESGQEMVKELIVSFQDLETSIKQFHDDTEALTDSGDITNNFEQMLASMLEISNKYKDSIHVGGNDLITGFISGFTHVEGRDAGFTISNYISEALNDTVEVIKRYSGPFSDSGKEMAQNLVTEFQNLETSMKQFHTDTEALAESSDITNNFEAMLKSLVDLSVSYTGKIHTTGSDLIASFVSSLTHYDGRDTGFTVVTYFSGVMSESIEEIGSYQNSAKTAGANFVQGLIQGMQSKATELKNVVNTLAGISIKTTMEVLDEHSPSRVMYKLGAYAIEGFINGMKDEAGSVGEVAQTMAGAVAAIGKDLPDYTVSFGDEAYIATALALKGVTAGTVEYEEAVSSAAAANLKFATSLYAATDEYKSDKEEVAKLTEELKKLREEEEKASNKYSEAVAKAESETGKAAEYMQSKWDKAQEAIAGVGGALGDQIIGVLGAYMTSLDIYDSMEEGIDKLKYKDTVDANKSALDGLIDSMDDSTDAAKEQKESIKSVVDELVNARSESNSLIKGFNDDVKETEETVKSSADAIMDKEDELAKKNQEMFDKIVKQWKDYIKKIKDAVKQYTDIFSGVADSIDLYAERSKPEELQLTEHEAMESKADVEQELADAQRELAEAQARSDAVEGRSLIALQQIEDANNRILEAKQKIQEIDERNAEIEKRNAEIDAENAKKQYEQTSEYAAEEMAANMQAALQKYKDYQANVELIEQLDFEGPAKEYIKELVRGGYSNAEQIAKIVSAATSGLGVEFMKQFNSIYAEKSLYESESYRQSIINKMQETQEWSNKIAALEDKHLNENLINEMIDQGPDNSQLVNMIYDDVQRDGEAAIKYWNGLYGDIETNSNNIANTITSTVSGLSDAIGVSASAIVQAILQTNAGDIPLSVYGEQLRTLLASNAELSRLWANVYGENLNKWTPDMEDSRVVYASKLAAAAVNEEINRLNKESNGLFAIQNGLLNIPDAVSIAFTTGAEEFAKTTGEINSKTIADTAQTAATTFAETTGPLVSTAVTPVTDNQVLALETEGKEVDAVNSIYRRMEEVRIAVVNAIHEHLRSMRSWLNAINLQVKGGFNSIAVKADYIERAIQSASSAICNAISNIKISAPEQSAQSGGSSDWHTGTPNSTVTITTGTGTNGSTITRKYDDTGTLVEETGKMTHVVKGVMPAAKKAGEAVGQAYGNGIATGTKKSLGIKSPSRVFMEIGKFVDLGFAKGVKDNTPKVAAALSALGNFNPDRQLLDFRIQNGNLLDFGTTRNLARGISPNSAVSVERLMRDFLANQNSAAPSNTDNSTTTNNFNITSNNPKEVAYEVDKILQKRTMQRRNAWA